MKVMSRDFTRFEKILLVLLGLILVGLVYYRFVDQTVRDSIAASNAEYDEVQQEFEALQARVDYLQGIQTNMDDLEAQGKLSWMASYNNSKEEVRFLNDILADTLNYSVSFANVTRSGNQVRRSFTLTYRTDGYKAAQEIIKRLLSGKNRCLVTNISCGINTDGTVNMSQSATFYETMVGGINDAALPATQEDTKVETGLEGYKS